MLNPFMFTVVYLSVMYSSFEGERNGARLTPGKWQKFRLHEDMKRIIADRKSFLDGCYDESSCYLLLFE